MNEYEEVGNLIAGLCVGEDEPSMIELRPLECDVMCCGKWTDWHANTYHGKTFVEALRKAMLAKKGWTFEQEIE